MMDRFVIFYEMNLKKCKSEYLTEDELGHEIARLMRNGACDVQVVIFDSERLIEIMASKILDDLNS